MERADKSAHRDVLTFDGSQFQYVFEQLLAYFKEAAQKALGNNGRGMVQQIMKQLRNLSAENEEELRRNTKKMR